MRASHVGPMRSVMHLRRRFRPLVKIVSARALIAGLPLLTACAPADLLNALVPSSGYEVSYGLAYGTDDRQRLDVYRPVKVAKGSDESKPAIIVYLYGGSWRSGERGYYRFVGEAFANLGFPVVVPDYRLYPDVTFPAFVTDAAKAVAWVQANAETIGGDGDRLILVGHSAGAHIAALLALDSAYLQEAGVPSDAIRGVVGLAGPYAFDPLAYDWTRPVFADSDPRLWRPVSLARSGTPPLFLLHGLDDRTVKPHNTTSLADAVQAAGGTARASLYPDVGHIGIVVSLAAPFRGRDTVFDDVAAFVTRVSSEDPPS